MNLLKRTLLAAPLVGLLLLPLQAQAPKMQLNDAARRGPDLTKALKVTAPNDGGPWFTGNTYEVRWIPGQLLTQNVRIVLKTQAAGGGGTYDIVASIPVTAQKFAYTVPTSFGQTGIPYRVTFISTGPDQAVLAESLPLTIQRTPDAPTPQSCGAAQTAAHPGPWVWTGGDGASAFVGEFEKRNADGSYSKVGSFESFTHSYVAGLGQVSGIYRWRVKAVKKNAAGAVVASSGWSSWCGFDWIHLS